MKIKFYKHWVELWDLLQIRFTIAGITIFGLSIGKFYALNVCVKGVIITVLNLTIQITDK